MDQRLKTPIGVEIPRRITLEPAFSTIGVVDAQGYFSRPRAYTRHDHAAWLTPHAAHNTNFRDHSTVLDPLLFGALLIGGPAVPPGAVSVAQASRDIDVHENLR